MRIPVCGGIGWTGLVRIKKGDVIMPNGETRVDFCVSLSGRLWCQTSKIFRFDLIYLNEWCNLILKSLYLKYVIKVLEDQGGI